LLRNISLDLKSVSFLLLLHPIDCSLDDVQSLLDIDATDAEELMISLSRNQKTRSDSLLSPFMHALTPPSTLVNAVVILAAMVIVAEPAAATIETRKKTLFSIMDFNGLGRINLDELVSESPLSSHAP
jgi:hypothetical protein